SLTYDAGSLDEGQHTLDVSVADPAGNVTDRSIFIDLDTAPPQVQIVSIAGDNVVNANEAASLVQVVGTVDGFDAVGPTVRIIVNGEWRGTAVVLADRTWHADDVDFSGASGATAVQAEIEDRAGNLGTGSATAFVDSDFIRVSVGADGAEGLGDPSFTFGFT